MNRCRTLLTLSLAALALLAPTGRLLAQVWNDDDLEQRRERRQVRQPRLVSNLAQINTLRKSNPELALDVLQTVLLDAPEDVLFQSAAGNSLKDAAEQILLTDSGDFLQQYERRFGATALGLLEAARKSGTTTQRREVARRYGVTAAGRQAAFELAEAACDSGDPATALTWITRLRKMPSQLAPFEPRVSLIELWALRELGDVTRLDARIADLRQQFPNGLVDAEKTLRWFNEAPERDAWLDRLLARKGDPEPSTGLPAWPMANGDPRRNGVSSDAPPFLDNAWSYSITDRYDDDIHKYDDDYDGAAVKQINEWAAQVEARFRREGVIPVPVAQPLIVGDVALFSGLGSVKALSLATGDLLWSSLPVDETLSTLLAGTDQFAIGNKTGLTQRLLAQRAYRDHVNAAMSTDGKVVYHVGQGGMGGSSNMPISFPSSNRGVSPLLPRNYNQLQAYDIRGGVCLWSIGGPARQMNAVFNRQEPDSDLSGAFFCTAPIPWNNELLCLVEQSGQLRVVSLDANANPEKTPPLWSQPLLNSDFDLIYAPDRRFVGATAALDGSTLITALGNGTVAAFDVATRRWLWLQTYSDPQRVDYRRSMNMGRGRAILDDPKLESIVDVNAWADQRVLISGRSIVATPADDQRLICFDRQTGAILWSRPRDQAMFLAGVYEDIVVVVGRSEIRAVHLRDGSPVWSTPIPAPSGHGVRMGSRYTLPLTTAEVLTIDVKTGAPLARSPLMSGRAAGNVCAAGGTLVTQTASEFRAYRSADSVNREVQMRLDSNPRDSVALALRGEARLHRGQIEDGERDLRDANDLSPRVAQVLAWATVNGLVRDFSTYFSPTMDADTLSADPNLRMHAWRAISAGLEAKGDLPGALLTSVRAGEHIDLNTDRAGPGADRLLDREGTLRVRESRLLRGRIRDLWDRMATADRDEAVRRVCRRLEDIPPNSPQLFRAYAMTSGYLLPAEVELEFLARKTQPAAVTEQRLLELRESSDLKTVALADLQLLDLAAGPASASILNELAGRLREVVVEDGKTASQAVAELLQKKPSLAATPLFSGPLKIGEQMEPGMVSETPISLPDYGPRSAILEGWTLTSDIQGMIHICDANGIRRSLEGVARNSSNPGRISTCGRLVLLETGEGFRITDALATTNVSSFTLVTEQFDPYGGGRFPPFGMGRTTTGMRSSARSIAPLQREHVAYIKGNRLIVADPMKSMPAAELWSRDVETVAELSADREYVALLDLNQHMQVFRAVDGQPAGECTLPPGLVYTEYRRDIQKLIRIDTVDGREIGLFHPARNQFTWKKKFPPRTTFDVLNGSDIAVRAPDGTFTLLAGADGRETLQAHLEPMKDDNLLSVFQDESRLFVRTVRDSGPTIMTSIPLQARSLREQTGRLTALDRATGKVLWSRHFDRLGLDTVQPAAWPFLMLLAASGSDEVPGENRAERPVAALVIDRATGETLYSADLRGRDGQRGWKVDAPPARSVTCKLSGVSFQIAVREDSPKEPSNETKGADAKSPTPEPKSNQ